MKRIEKAQNWTQAGKHIKKGGSAEVVVFKGTRWVLIQGVKTIKELMEAYAEALDIMRTDRHDHIKEKGYHIEIHLNTIKAPAMKNNELATSLGNIAKVPVGLNRAVEMGFKKVLNFGCGLGYKFHAEALKDKIELLNYDPYISEVAELGALPADVEAVFCNNVLNVIEDLEDIKGAIQQMKAQGLPIYITIYEGDKTGAGRITSRGTYQRNQKAKDYLILKEAGFTFKKGMWFHENSSK